MYAKKGDLTHKKLGKLFFYSMLTNALVSLPLSYLHPNYFLFIVGILGLYMAITGKRYLKIKTINDVRQLDWVTAIIMFLFGITFIALGIYNLQFGNNFGVVFLAFGLISVLFSYQDNKNFKGKSIIKNYWLTTHIQRMVGSYIVAITAFLVINNTILPGYIAWPLPTILLVPLIVKWSRKYRKLKEISE